MKKRKNKVKIFNIISLFLSIIIAVFVFIASLGSNDTDLFITAISFIPLVIVFSFNILARSTELFTSLNFILLSTVLGVTLRVIYIALFPDGYSSSHLMNGEDNKILIPAIYLICVALLSLGIGYMISKKPLKLHWVISKATYPINLRKLLLSVGFLLIVGLISVYFYVSDIGLANILERVSAKRNLTIEDSVLSASSGYLTWATFSLTIAVMLLLVYGKETRFSFKLLFVILLVFLSTLIIPVISSSRSGILNPIILMLMFVHYRIHKLKVLKIALFSVAAIFMLSYMSVQRVADQKSISISEAMGDYSFINTYQDSVGNRHFLGVAKTALIMKNVPERVGYQKGSTLLSWVFLPIPRYLWKEKPDVRPGLFVGEHILDQGETNGTPPGFVGELYLNGGWLFVIVGMFLLGVFLRKVDLTVLQGDHYNSVSFYIYITILFNLSFKLVSSDFGGAMIDTIKMIVPLLVIISLIKRKRVGRSRVDGY